MPPMARYRPSGEEERRFLEAYDPTRYPRPSVTVDSAVLRRTGRGLEALLIKRGGFPYRGRWALPGGFLEIGDDADLVDGAARELEEETGLRASRLVPFGCFGRKGRDPRARTVTAAFFCIAPGDAAVEGRDDAVDAAWLAVRVGRGGRAEARRRGRPVQLAFDHDEVLGRALVELGSRARAALPLLALLDPETSVAEAEALALAACRGSSGPSRGGARSQGGCDG